MHPNVKLLKKTYAEQRSQEWLDLRKNMLGKWLATAIGENKYEKPFDLLSKSVVRESHLLEMQPRNTVTNTKTKLAFSMNRDTMKLYTKLVSNHTKHPWLGGSPDVSVNRVNS